MLLRPGRQAGRGAFSPRALLRARIALLEAATRSLFYPAANRQFFKAVTDGLEAHVKHGEIRQLPHDLYYGLWIAPVQEFGRRWLDGHADTAIDQAAEILGDAAWRSLATVRKK